MAGTPLQKLRLLKAADVYKAGDLAGLLRRLPDRTEFSYLPAYLDRRGQPIAWSLPAKEGVVTAPAAAVPAFFAGLLPEGRRLTALRRGVGTSADDEFSMLLAAGSDTIGDVQVVPPGEPPIPSTATEIDDFSTADFAELFAEAIGPRPDRTGLPGIQDKVSGRMVNMPVAGRSGSYILKLNPPEFPHLVENEHLFFKAAARTRIRLAEVELVRDRHESPGLLVRRFDRPETAGGVQLLAVEDACQVLGRWPGDKYVISTEDAFTALARCCRAPGVAAMELLRLLIFAYLSGNGDLHAKNLAVLRNPSGEWRISPAYDLPSSAFYGNRSMALPIAGSIRQQVSWTMLRNLAGKVEVPEDLAASLVREQIAAAEAWVDDVDQLPFDSSRVATFRRLVRARVRHIQP